jgi:hypothetical protein
MPRLLETEGELFPSSVTIGFTHFTSLPQGDSTQQKAITANMQKAFREGQRSKRFNWYVALSPVPLHCSYQPESCGQGLQQGPFL